MLRAVRTYFHCVSGYELEARGAAVCAAGSCSWRRTWSPPPAAAEVDTIARTSSRECPNEANGKGRHLDDSLQRLSSGDLDFTVMAYTGSMPLPPGRAGAAASSDEQSSVSGPASISASPPLLEPCQVQIHCMMCMHGRMQLCQDSVSLRLHATVCEPGRGYRVQRCSSVGERWLGAQRSSRVQTMLGSCEVSSEPTGSGREAVAAAGAPPLQTATVANARSPAPDQTPDSEGCVLMHEAVMMRRLCAAAPPPPASPAAISLVTAALERMAATDNASAVPLRRPATDSYSRYAQACAALVAAPETPSRRRAVQRVDEVCKRVPAASQSAAAPLSWPGDGQGRAQCDGGGREGEGVSAGPWLLHDTRSGEVGVRGAAEEPAGCTGNMIGEASRQNYLRLFSQDELDLAEDLAFSCAAVDEM